VCDGHGQYGEKVSAYLKNKLPLFLDQELKFMMKKYEEEMKQSKTE